MNTKLTVVVPVYNVSKYLEKCLESIINQTLKELEILCINDGSTDNSQEIIEQFAKKDKRIVVINQENGGLSFTRNKGINIAKGEYVAFVDSDDYIDTDFYEKLYNKASETNADIAVGGVIKFYENKKIKKMVEIKKEVVVNKTEDKFKVCNVPKYNQVWNKIYKLEKIKNHNIFFKEGVFYEDIEWTHKVLLYLSKLVSVKNTNYHYRYNPNSIANTGSEKHRNDLMTATKNAIEFSQKNKINIRNWRDYLCFNKKVFSLFKIPVLTIRTYGNHQIFYLFGFIPIMDKIKNL